MELSDESGRRLKVGQAKSKQQQQQPQRHQRKVLLIMNTIAILIILSALSSPSVSLVSSSSSSVRAANKGALITRLDAAATVGAQAAASSFTSAQQVAAVAAAEPHSNSKAANRVANGNGNEDGQSIRESERREKADPLWVPLAKANDHSEQQQQQQRILKKFGPQDPSIHFSEQVNSADLPAEFRDESMDLPDQVSAEAPREQSKLAKLCEQTSSVLASVLPAPFGGHKRSILCQFFGQLPMISANGRKNANKVATSKEQNPMESVAVIHPLEQTPQQQPIMLMRPMKHPIELLLEHQRQQVQLASRIQQQQQQQQQLQTQDLKSAASVLDYSFHQRVEPPPAINRHVADERNKRKSTGKDKTGEKFSQPMKVSSSPLLSTSGWRIFESLPEHSNQTSSSSTPVVSVPTLAPKGTTKAPHKNQTETSISSSNQISTASQHVSKTTTTSNATSTPKPNASSTQAATAATTISIQEKLNLSREKLGAAQLLVLGRPPNYAASSQNLPTQTTVSKRSESFKSTTRKQPEQPAESRTIEVIAQSNNPSQAQTDAAVTTAAKRAATDKLSTTSASQIAAVVDLSSGQVQNREELVIASINNLTRIAFGNQLRDTFKVINRLIDQQASLFASSAAPKGEPDSMMTSESQKVTKKMPTDAGAESKKKTKSRDKEIHSQAVDYKTSTQNPKTNRRTSQTAVVAKQKNETDAPGKQSSSKLNNKSVTSNPDSTKFKASESKQPERKSSISGLESRRIPSSVAGSHTVSRSLALDSIRKTTPMKPLAPFETSWQTTVVDDIRRDRSSRGKAQPNSEAFLKSNSPAAQNQLVTVTQYPWLIPDERSTDLFGFSWPAQTTRVTAAKKRQPTSATSKRWIPKAADSSVPFGSSTRKRDLVLNRLETRAAERPTTKMDSLTTLKMSLDLSKSSPSTPSISTSASSSIPQGSSTQSRWMPTLGVSRPKSSAAITTSTMPRAETTVSSTTPMPTPETTKAEVSKSKPTEPATQSDLMEARASDSISKFTTTHWNEANEMLATTRRLFQQPQPQIAQTGEFFNAETIASWPERYQTMLENNLRSTVSMETTRRNGETYATSGQAESTVQPTTTTTAERRIPRHKYDTTAPVTDQQQQQVSQTTRRMDQVPFDSSSFTVLPANHKLSTSSDEPPSTTGTADTQTAKATTSMFSELLTTKLQSNQTVPLRPPYSDLQHSTPADSAEIGFDRNSSASARKAIYEELLKLPSTTRSFVGPHNSLAHRGLNLSALRLLSQGLFATLGSSETGLSEANRSLISPPVEQAMGTSSQNKVADSETLNNSDRLLEMLGAQNSSLPMLPMSQYELSGMNSSAPLDGDHEEMDTKTNSSSKWLLGRASNLLNDLKQLEQRKAAALLAAIRYQIPGPLVRPWDLNSDLQQASDRLDGAESELIAGQGSEAERDYLKAGLWMSKAGEAIRSAILKQRVVPRNELEARLSGRRIDESWASNRRSDGTIDEPDNSFVLMDERGEARKHDANYVLVAGNSSSSSEEDSDRSLRKILLGQSSKHHNKTKHLIKGDWPEESISIEQQTRQQYPKYIHFSDYRTSLSPRTDEMQPKLSGQLSSSATIAARLRNNTNITRQERTQPAIEIEGAKRLDKEAEDQSFDCSNKSAGFHPDANTNCQTFFHCSNTGHLLTFRCPQQTRFDQRSLKCGPWYEVSCDLGRASIRQHPLTSR